MGRAPEAADAGMIRAARSGSAPASPAPSPTRAIRARAARIEASSQSCVVSTTGTTSPGRPAALQHGLHADGVVAQDAGDIGDHARAGPAPSAAGSRRRHGVPSEPPGRHPAPRRRRPRPGSPGRAPGRSGRRRPALAVGPAPAPRPSSMIRPTIIAFRHHRVEDASTRAIGAADRHHAGMHPRPRCRPASAAAMPEQLDPVAELGGKAMSSALTCADALDMDGREIDRPAEGERRQDRQLVRRVDAVDVEGRDRPRRSRAPGPRRAPRRIRASPPASRSGCSCRCRSGCRRRGRCGWPPALRAAP